MENKSFYSNYLSHMNRIMYLEVEMHYTRAQWRGEGHLHRQLPFRFFNLGGCR